jgi:predicted PolB exonuclease-like 3'-5' exonuclease
VLILSSGITGFQPAPSVKENKFKQTCYSQFGSRVLDFTGGETIKNFYEAVIKKRIRKFISYLIVNILLSLLHVPVN